MRIFFDSSTVCKGGGLQVAVSFIREAIADGENHHWRFVVSPQLFDEFQQIDPHVAAEFAVQQHSPSRNRQSRRELAQLEADFSPDAVFSLFGPTYTRFSAPHLMGTALCWVTHSTWMSYRSSYPPIQWPKLFLGDVYRGLWLRGANGWVIETETARRGLSRRFLVPAEKIAVVSNTCGQLYFESQQQRPFPAAGQRVRFLCFAAAYGHKRLEMIPHVARSLAELRPQLDFQFVITLPSQEPVLEKIMRKARDLGVEDRIHNEGWIAVADGPALYRGCDVCFLPTVLETFTATYPESMAMGLPIVTSRLGFATDVCRDAALYFEPNDTADAAAKLDQLLGDEVLWNRLIADGKNVLRSLPTPRQKYDQYIECLENMVGGRPIYQPRAGR